MKYAVITGASSGIGKEFARRLAARGYALVLVARREDRLNKLAAKFKTECRIIAADLTKKEECERVVSELEDIEIDIFINNAGFGDCSAFADSNLDRELAMIDLNVRAVHFLTKKILARFEKQGHGYLLNVASSAGLMPAGPYMAAYYASKAYVTSLTRAIAEELKEAGSLVYIGCLCPGPVDTEFNRVADVEFALPGITPGYCAGYALRQMLQRRQVVIIPTVTMKLAAVMGRIMPQNLVIYVAGRQQKRKLYGTHRKD